MERRQSVKKDGTESKTPRYAVTAQAGYFKPLQSIRNAKNEIVMYYQRNEKCNPNSTAEMLDVDLSTLWRWNNEKYLCAVEVGGKRKYKLSEVNKILRKGEVAV
jgi:hypothetical protein